ncbi:hypothetical protein BT96DRAFT_792675, partial [Gymnopus androsaceus JB14]
SRHSSMASTTGNDDPMSGAGSTSAQTSPPTTGKRGRRNQHSSRRSKRTRNAPSTNFPPDSLPKKKKAGFHLTKQDVPDNAKGVQNAFHVHIRIMWMSFSQEDVPLGPDLNLKNSFNERFKSSNEADIGAHVDALIAKAIPASLEAIPKADEVRRTAHRSKGMLAHWARQIEEPFLVSMFTAVANAGLTRWAPDVLGTPDSPYNVLHERIAVTTFRQLLTSFVYTKMNANISFAEDHILLSKLYRSYIFSHMLKKARRELADSRVQHLKDQGYRDAVIRLIKEPDANSDDELDPNAPPGVVQYRIKAKPERSDLTTAFLQWSAPALNAPIDYFSPWYYNNVLTLRERAMYMNNGVALPLPQHCQSADDIRRWRKLSTKKFMEEYGNNVLDLYDIPTEEELERL